MTSEFFQYSDQKIRWPLNSSSIPIRILDDHRILMETTEFFKYSLQELDDHGILRKLFSNLIGLTNISIRKLDDHRILKFWQNNQYSDQKIRWPQNSYKVLKVWPIFRSENKMTTEFLWNSRRITHIPIRKLGDPGILMKLRNSSRIRWPWNSYIRVLLEFFKS